MGNYNSYAKDAAKIMKAAIDDYSAAVTRLKKAEEQAKTYPEKMGMVDADYVAKSARAKADLLDAKAALTTARDVMHSKKSELKAIRNKLSDALDDDFSADASKLDSNTMELLKSGILKPAEYQRLLEKAENNGNYTMARMVAQYAGKAVDEAAKNYGEGSEQARALRVVSYQGNKYNGNETLGHFDALMDAYERTINNPFLADKWDELTAPIVDEI